MRPRSGATQVTGFRNTLEWMMRNGGKAAMRSRESKPASQAFGTVGARSATASLALLLALATGCTNNLLKIATGIADSTVGATPNGIATDSDSGFRLARVQKNATDPAGTLDLIGDGSGTLGSLCVPPASGGSAGSGASTCRCSYTYIDASGSQIGPVEVDTTYRERDMIRCPYSTVPTDISFFTVSVRATNTDTKSNDVTFKLAGSGVSLDLANRESFTQVQRYQCRDIVFIPYLFDQAVYDPFLSEDPRYSYPLNFYTTNMGRTLATYAAGDPSRGITAPLGWNCPAIPNDSAQGMDLTLFSVAADSTGSKAIYPPGGAFDRSTFFVARAKTGVFNVGVNAYAFPGTFTTNQPTPVAGQPSQTTGLPPLGYAARPIPLAAGGETCPDTSVTIPQGFHWAKLWLFRKQLPQRTYPTSNNLGRVGPISCNPRPWTPSAQTAAPNDTFFTDCSGAPHMNSRDANGLAARVFEGTGVCATVKAGGTTDPNTLEQLSAPVDFTQLAKGTDTFSPMRKDAVFGCGGSGQVPDFANVCDNSTGNVAYDSTIPLAQGAIDASVANPRFDYLFVVSPVSVNRSDMDPTSGSHVHQIYTPLRFMSPTDCRSPDPDHPLTAGDCNATRMLAYQLKKHEVGSPGNPGQDDPNRAGDFPLCVLQPN